MIYAYHFWSPTCQPCKVIKPAVEELKQEFSDIQWVSVNTHEDPSNLVKKYKVSIVPTIVFVVINQDGTPINIDKHTGTDMASYFRLAKKATQLSSK